MHLMEAAAAEAASQEARRLVLARDAAEGGAAALLEQLQAAHPTQSRPIPSPIPIPNPSPNPGPSPSQAAHGEVERLEARVAELEGAALVAAEEVPHAHQPSPLRQP